ncbi:MAG: hypothetical protein PF488_01185 [Patescibacteria group bacterium]|jgi:photosystem II stability/assembly factor-like uncharacterized protein|nr:hypothetical protein [Patescibacteria group bacterium]
MKNIKKIFLLFVVVSGAAILSACSISSNSEGSGPTGNIFFSADKGTTFKLINTMPTIGQEIKSIGGVEVDGFYSDPSDSRAVYMASRENGLFYTYDITKGWNVANLNEPKIESVAVSHDNKCLIYVAAKNRLYRTTDCSRSFSQTYYDTSTDLVINDVVVDFYNPKNIYIATSRGEVIKSIDRGESWRTIWRFEEPVLKLLLSPLDSRKIFAATKSNRVYSFFSDTTTEANLSNLNQNFEATRFKDLNDVLADMEIGDKFTDIKATNDGDIYLATNKAILRSPDDGITWEKISLLSSEEDSNILAIDVNPKNGDEIYYGSATTFFKSLDGGVSWNSKRLSTSWRASDIMVDYREGNNIYLGAERQPKEEGSGFLKVGLVD